ncbi:hypothetical protein IV55_GL001678 [Furfurilactobacillus siliginis]|uniref:Uncharacterized protein n=1 Tax=Furfurilactobacillus siliginis TaxID=348151 RepID=A0A0R2L2Y6_9LACO|nr:hypothetical protein IV55_GL001678 [Furfurilactobacillus siliginis]
MASSLAAADVAVALAADCGVACALAGVICWSAAALVDVAAEAGAAWLVFRTTLFPLSLALPEGVAVFGVAWSLTVGALSARAVMPPSNKPRPTPNAKILENSHYFPDLYIR